MEWKPPEVSDLGMERSVNSRNARVYTWPLLGWVHRLLVGGDPSGFQLNRKGTQKFTEAFVPFEFLLRVTPTTTYNSAFVFVVDFRCGQIYFLCFLCHISNSLLFICNFLFSLPVFSLLNNFLMYLHQSEALEWKKVRLLNGKGISHQPWLLLPPLWYWKPTSTSHGIYIIDLVFVLGGCCLYTWIKSINMVDPHGNHILCFC